jgi:DinB family protein
LVGKPEGENAYSRSVTAHFCFSGHLFFVLNLCAARGGDAGTLVQTMNTRMTPDEKPRYPIGRYQPASITAEERAAWIAEIEALPGKLRDAASGLNEKQLDTPYRPGGWTVRQVVHHVPDSHMNSYSRFRLALTEHSPIVKPYDQAAWAELVDEKSAPIEPSLAPLAAI